MNPQAWNRKLARVTQTFRADGMTGLMRAASAALIQRSEELGRRLRAHRRRVLEFGIRPHLLRRRVAHLHGPECIQYGRNELIVVCVVRNGTPHVPSFMEHYRRLGVAHAVFLDNGSTDGTADGLRTYADVTVLQTDAPYQKYENTMKRYLTDRFSAGRWSLCADIDELFDYPFSDRLPLRGFLQYLNTRHFTAVLTQMLDMFSDVPLTQVESAPDRLKETYRFYDTSAIDRRPYSWSTAASSNLRMHWGGIRRAVFGTNNGLTKASLVRLDGKVRPFVEWHQVTGARMADVSGVLLHFPFVAGFQHKVQDAIRTGRYGATTTDEYVAYGNALAQNPGLRLMRPTAQRFTGLEPLLAEGFLVASDEYRAWVEDYGARVSTGPASTGPAPGSTRR